MPENTKSHKYSNDLMVLLLTKENPKKPSGKAAARFAKYPRHALTVAEVLKIEDGPIRKDLDWDAKHGFIFIGTKDEVAKILKKS